MGGICSSANSTAYAVMDPNLEQNKFVERQLQEARIKDQLNFKVLTLGAGESGKSTLVKQLIFIHKGAMLSSDDRASYIKVLHNNTLQCIHVFLQQLNDPQNASIKEKLDQEQIDVMTRTLKLDQNSDLTESIVADINLLWTSAPLQAIYAKRHLFWHLEASEYYFNNAHRFVEDEFLPTDEDVVMARKRTTGVVETEFDYAQIRWTVVDVGGQRSERRKWINCFDDVKAIMFVVNLSGYANVLFEDGSVNRMHESLNLFQQTMSNPRFMNTPVFLMLNKKDLFEKMIRTRPLNTCFPEYTGENDTRSSLDYISEQYQQRLPPQHKPAIIHLIAARYKKDVQYAFEEIKDVLLDGNASQVKRALKASERLHKQREKEAQEQVVNEQKLARLQAQKENTLQKQGSQLLPMETNKDREIIRPPEGIEIKHDAMNAANRASVSAVTLMKRDSA